MRKPWGLLLLDLLLLLDDQGILLEPTKRLYVQIGIRAPSPVHDEPELQAQAMMQRMTTKRMTMTMMMTMMKRMVMIMMTMTMTMMMMM